MKGDPNGSYMLVARALTARARLEISVDGAVVLTRAETEQAGLTEITRPVRIRKESNLIVRVFGPAGSGGEVAVLGGATTLDATGGTVVSPKTGARVSVAAGVLSGAAVVSLRDLPLRSPIHSSISAVASRFMLSGLSAQTIGAGNISIDLPLSRPPQQGATLVLRGDFDGVNSDPVWRDGTYDSARVFVVTGSALSFVQQSPKLGDSLAVALSVEEYVPPGIGTVSRVSAYVTPPTGTTSICQLNPFSGLTQLYGDGLGDQSAPSIWYDASGPSLATARQAIVLIHGWSKWQTTCGEYRRDDRVDEYFKELIASLRAPTNGLSNVPLLLVDYPTYNAYASTAADLAPGLDKVAADFGLDFVVVAHSMGGLVARAATHFQKRQPLAIITLDTPHLGTPAASNTGFWSLAQNSPALPGLASGLAHANSEPHLIAYGSRVTFTPHPIGNGGQRSYTTDAVPQYWSATTYHVPGGWLCDGGDCVSDGIVPDWSSLPSFVPAADQRAFVGFDHTFMRGAGGFPPGVESSLTADIKSFLTGVPSAPTALTALVTGSHTVTLSWTDNSSDEDKFIVESATDPSGPFVDVGETLADGTRIDLVVVPAVVTYYRVSADRGGLRSGSATTSATPLSEFPSRGVSATAVWNGRLLTFGVSPNGYSSGRTFSYDPTSDVWTEQRYFGGAPLTIGGYSGEWGPPSRRERAGPAVLDGGSRTPS
ncbi:MAG: hypothetical protein IPJ56_11735 [Gemmatimonadetes bacterium]|nr:hypothetical protein [Gemmatimonadota bacterium]